MKSPDFDGQKPLEDKQNDHINMAASQTNGLQSDFSSLSRNSHFLDLNSVETKQKIEFMKIQSQVWKYIHCIFNLFIVDTIKVTFLLFCVYLMSIVKIRSQFSNICMLF